MPRPRGIRTANQTLRALRVERALSQEDLAAAIRRAGWESCDKRTVQRWESGETTSPQYGARRALEAVLGVSYSAMGFEDPDASVSRRRLLAAAAGTAAGAMEAVGLAALAQPALVPVPELVGYFQDQLAGHYLADRLLGPIRLIPAAIPQHQLLCELASVASGGLRREFWSLATGYGALLGWLYQDVGDLRASTYWLDTAIERAHRTQDVQLVGFALHNKAMLLGDMRDGLGVLDLTGAVLHQRARLCPKVQVLALQQAAHGTSLVAGPDAGVACDRLLDAAAEQLSLIDDDYPWGGACQTSRYVDVQRATVYTRLGRTREALDLWEQVIPGMLVSARRDLGVFRARQAQALADFGEPEQSVAVAGEVVSLAVQTQSARMIGELRALRGRMQPWADEAPGRALHEMLSEFPAE